MFSRSQLKKSCTRSLALSTWLLVEDVLVVEHGVAGAHHAPRDLRRRGVEGEVSELGDGAPVAVVIEVVALWSVVTQLLELETKTMRRFAILQLRRRPLLTVRSTPV